MSIGDTQVICLDELNQQAPEPVVLHVISDSTGATATGVVQGATVQFPSGVVQISCLSHVENMDQIRAYLDAYVQNGSKTAIFHTLLNNQLRRDLRDEAEQRGIASVDVLGPTLSIVSKLMGTDPLNIPGLGITRENRLIRNIDARLIR